MAAKELSARMLIQQLHNATDPKFAVFMRTQSGKSARFKSLHKCLETAVEACREHAASAAAHGSLDFTYYAIEIKHRVGIEAGKLVDESMK